MWIKELPIDYENHTSFCYGGVMIWQNEKVYVMDNHLSAAWCWLQSCDANKKYNFMHIDRHYDMLECFYDDEGRITETCTITAGTDCCGMQVEQGRWHKLVSHESGTIIFEAKDGSYEPISQEDILEFPH